MGATAKLLDAHSLLPDPPLPGTKDMQRWWPEPKSAEPTTRPIPMLVRPQSARAAAAPPARGRPSPRQQPSPRQYSRPPSAAAFDAPGASTNFAAGKGGFSLADHPATVTEAVKLSTAALLSKDATGLERVAAAHAERQALEYAVEPADQPTGPRAVLQHWMDTYSVGEDMFASKAVFVEMRLRQALACSASLGTPNTFRCAIVCDAWDRVAPLTGRFEGLFQLLWGELLRSLYGMYAPPAILIWYVCPGLRSLYGMYAPARGLNPQPLLLHPGITLCCCT